MKVYGDGIYGVIETCKFHEIVEYILPDKNSDVKYMCANLVERKYLEDILNIDLSNIICDYYKIVKE